MQKLKKFGISGLALALMSAMPAMAQTNEQSAPSDEVKAPAFGETDSAKALPTLVVTGEKKSAILPTESNAFGLGQTLVETPRSVSTVSLSMIDQYSLQTVRDLIAVTPGVFTASFYGVDGTVDIRGEYADNFFRGFKRVENQGTYVTPIESGMDLEIVRGIASPAYGTGRAGGYVNFTPRSDKAVDFKNGKKASGEISGAVGTYDYYNVAGEYGSPFKIGDYNAGADLYVEKNQASQYFDGIKPKHKLVQFGFSTDLPSDWELDTGYQYYDASGMQGSTGINRLTQDLIDHGTYVSGSALAQLQTNGSYITPADVDAAGGVTKYYGASSAYSQLDPETIKTVKLSRHALLTTPYDYGNSKTNTAYLDLVKHLTSGDLKIQGFYDELKADSYNGYGFTKHLRDKAKELRVSYTDAYAIGSWLRGNVVAGVGYRGYKADEGYAYARGYMVLDRQDISSGATADTIFNPVYLDGAGYDQYYHSNVDEYGAFFNTSAKLFNTLEVTAGARYDKYDVRASNTGLTDWSVPLDTVYKNSKGATSWSLSVSYPTPIGLIPYVTWGRSYALETTQGGAVTPGDVYDDTFLSPTKLLEGGIKGNFFDDRLFSALSVYKQTRTQQQLLSSNFVGAVSRGIEGELRWAINQHFGLSAVATRQRTKIEGSSYLVVSPSVVGVQNIDGWGYIYEVSSSDYAGLENGYVDRTQPKYVYGLFGNYEVGNGLGFTLGGNYVAHTSGELPGAIVYPSYYLFRGSIHYDLGRYRFSVNVNNILDKRYYIPQRSTYTDAAVFPGEGRTAIFKVTVRL